MTKPWEETWEAEFEQSGGYDCMTDAYVVRRSRGTTLAVLDTWGRGESKDLDDCARLAAAAPEMARLLLALEWAGSEQAGMGDGTDDCCPACFAPAPYTVHFPARRVDAYTRTEARDEAMGGVHTPDCVLQAVLRKAGVLT